jgi:mRNA interferase YafQ
MIQTINRTSRFKREYRKAVKRGCDQALFNFVLGELVNERPLPEKYRDHALTGNYTGFRACHIQPDWLLIYTIEKDTLTLTLTRTGTHSDLLEK